MGANGQRWGGPLPLPHYGEITTSLKGGYATHVKIRLLLKDTPSLARGYRLKSLERS